MKCQLNVALVWYYKLSVRPNKLNFRFLVPARTPSQPAACLVCVRKLNYVDFAYVYVVSGYTRLHRRKLN